MQWDTQFTVGYTHRLRFVMGALSPENGELAGLISLAGPTPARVLFFVDTGITRGWPDIASQIRAYTQAHRHVFAGSTDIEIVPGGERAKNLPEVLQGILWRINESHLDRQSYIVAIGGGAVLDVVGYAAAIAHRGIRLIRMPTTTLAQADSGVGVKNGINAFGKKNFLGVFAAPWAVINDASFLQTLMNPDWRSGFSEAVKVALVKDAELFETIQTGAHRLRERDMGLALPIIERSAQLHLEHITRGGDPFELTTARPLDFGHWSAHKLEQMTNFTLPHGHAVAIGIALDVTYSMLTSLLENDCYAAIIQCLRNLGLPTYHPVMASNNMLLEGLEEFREHLGGQLTVTLLRDVGRPIDVHEIDRAKMTAAIHQLLATQGVPQISPARLEHHVAAPAREGTA